MLVPHLVAPRRLARRLSAIALASLGAAGVACAQEPTIAVSGDPGALVIATATPGGPPHPVVRSGTTYTVVVPEGRWTIVGSLAEPLPAGVTLTVTLAAPAGAVSSGPVSLATQPQELARAISGGTNAGLSITYRLTAATSAGTLPLTSVTVAFTVVQDR